MRPKFGTVIFRLYNHGAVTAGGGSFPGGMIGPVMRADDKTD